MRDQSHISCVQEEQQGSKDSLWVCLCVESISKYHSDWEQYDAATVFSAWYIQPMITSRSAIADKPHCSVGKIWKKYKCKKRASNIALSYDTKDISTCWTIQACASIIGKYNFKWKTAILRFWGPIGGLRSNVRCSSSAHWKVRRGLLFHQRK